MPTIYTLNKIQPKRNTYASKKDLISRYVYNTNIWRKLRIKKLSINPLCEKCYSKGIIKSGVDIHHIIPISKGKSIPEMKKLGFDINNLETLCEECHKEVHSNNYTFE